MRLLVVEFVTAGGLGPSPATSLLAEGRLMLDAVVEDAGRCGTVVTVDADETSDPDRLVHRWIDRYKQQRCDAALVIAPETGGVLRTTVHRMRRDGCRVIAPTDAVIELTGDKAASARWCQTTGVPHPPTYWGDRRAEIECDRIAKPIDGCGSLGIRMTRDRSARGGEILQDYVAGQPASIAIIGDGRRKWLTHPVTQHIDPTSLQYRGGRSLTDAKLIARATALGQTVADRLGPITGWIGIDVVLAAAAPQDCVIELNPRITTSYIGLRRCTSVNLIAAQIDTPARPTSWRPVCWDVALETAK